MGKQAQQGITERERERDIKEERGTECEDFRRTKTKKTRKKRKRLKSEGGRITEKQEIDRK